MEEDIKEILIALDNTTKKQLDKAIENADKEWSEMELEEDIKILEKNIENGIIYCGCGYHTEKAIENLIARYKELEKELLSKSGIYKIDINLKDDYIPKSKVKEIKEKILFTLKKGENVPVWKITIIDKFLQKLLD